MTHTANEESTPCLFGSNYPEYEQPQSDPKPIPPKITLRLNKKGAREFTHRTHLHHLHNLHTRGARLPQPHNSGKAEMRLGVGVELNNSHLVDLDVNKLFCCLHLSID